MFGRVIELLAHALAPDQAPAIAEIELGRRHHIWVPWATPTEESAAQPWMRLGFGLFKLLLRAGQSPIEVYPYGAFRTLSGGFMGNKRSAAGAVARIALLRSRGVSADWLNMWSHDSLDALAGALVASDHADGRAEEVTCGHDGSAIWLPAT